MLAPLKLVLQHIRANGAGDSSADSAQHAATGFMTRERADTAAKQRRAKTSIALRPYRRSPGMLLTRVLAGAPVLIAALLLVVLLLLLLLLAGIASSVLLPVSWLAAAILLLLGRRSTAVMLLLLLLGRRLVSRSLIIRRVGWGMIVVLRLLEY